MRCFLITGRYELLLSCFNNLHELNALCMWRHGLAPSALKLYLVAEMQRILIPPVPLFQQAWSLFSFSW